MYIYIYIICKPESRLGNTSLLTGSQNHKLLKLPRSDLQLQHKVPEDVRYSPH